ncbi:U3 small nucleolar RNA-associated protein 6-domain-containing protein [Powellomyces hirtus]|nr:U3 small nucleolar RNA-associated protein 6-domain-containing protein [Powellomyces hirtus]
MADQVQYHLEKMVPELEDLQDRGIFQAAEVRAIVKQRTAHEYRIHRIIPLKADFLRYIAYEENLERLRKKRKQRMGMDQAPTAEDIANGVKHSSLSDYSIMRRIHGLYGRLLQKFGGDKALWIQYFDWCRSTRSTKALAKVFAKAIQLHPTNDTFWIMAAAWEFQDNGNMSSARVLLQRGLRINPESKKLWVEYFKLELLWVEKIKERRKVLFKSDGSRAAETTTAIQPPSESVNVPELAGESSHPQTSISQDATLSSSIQSGSSSDTAPMLSTTLSATQQALLKVLIPRVIYRNAIQTHPHDLPFRLEFLAVYRLFPDTKDGQDELFDSLVADFPTHPDARATLAQRPLAGVTSLDPAYPAALKQAVDSFTQAVSEISTPAIHEAYTSFLLAQLASCDEENLKLYITHILRKAFASAHATQTGTEKLYLDWAAHLSSRSPIPPTKSSATSSSPLSPRAVLEQAVARIPTSAKLWTALISQSEQEDPAPLSATTLYESAVKAVTDPDDLAALWKRYLARLIDAEAIPLSDIIATTTTHKASNPFTRALAAVTAPNHAGPILAMYLTYTNSLGSIEDVRTLATYLTTNRVSTPKHLWRTWVDLEIKNLETSPNVATKRSRNGHPLKSNSDVMQRVRTVWDGLVAADPSDPDSWLAYIRFEIDTARDLDRSSAVHWRAEKAVHDKDAFQTAYQALLTAL